MKGFFFVLFPSKEEPVCPRAIRPHVHGLFLKPGMNLLELDCVGTNLLMPITITIIIIIINNNNIIIIIIVVSVAVTAIAITNCSGEFCRPVGCIRPKALNFFFSLYFFFARERDGVSRESVANPLANSGCD
jgi:hypothetical protein